MCGKQALVFEKKTYTPAPLACRIALYLSNSRGLKRVEPRESQRQMRFPEPGYGSEFNWYDCAAVPLQS